MYFELNSKYFIFVVMLFLLGILSSIEDNIIKLTKKVVLMISDYEDAKIIKTKR